jgi:hypothetical protein
VPTNNHLRRGRRSAAGRGAFVYEDYVDNHVVSPGRARALKAFVEQKYGKLQHKLKNARSSNSEDALTWSCFDTLRQVNAHHRRVALTEMWELSFRNRAIPSGIEDGEIHIGKTYGKKGEQTEADLSIEGAGVFVLFEAKLYSPMSQADPPAKAHNQIARKLRVGVQEAARQRAEFYFILLDIAPLDALRSLRPRVTLAEAQRATASGLRSKWLTSYWYSRYKFGWKGSLAPLEEVLSDAPAIDGITAAQVAMNMGWLTWADVFKSVLRALSANQAPL